MSEGKKVNRKLSGQKCSEKNNRTKDRGRFTQ